MSKYRYQLSDYHAVGKADILLEGITVLSGENGSGKSTLSLWLYYLVNGSRRYEEFVYNVFENNLQTALSPMSTTSREILQLMTLAKFPSDLDFSSIMRPSLWFSKENNVDMNHERNMSRMTDFYVKATKQYAIILEEFLNDKTVSKDRQKRVLNQLGFEDYWLDRLPKVVADTYSQRALQKLNTYTEQLHSALNKRQPEVLKQAFQTMFGETDSVPNQIQLFEDDVALLDNDLVYELYNLNRAIYIDSPLALSNRTSHSVFWEELNKLILEDGGEVGATEKKMVRRIEKLLHGRAKRVEKFSLFSNDAELHYVDSDNNIEIEVDKTATGFKTFIYLQRLLENGYLTKNTIVLVDEPEVHLHPQWIVEYARLLVLLNKSLGVKFLLASHNPDMVAAIRAIAEREGTLEQTHFYLAERDDSTAKYIFKDLGTEIGEIFSSFNIALNRIQMYGTDSL